MIIVIRNEIAPIIGKRMFEIENTGRKIGHPHIQVAANHIPILDRDGQRTIRTCLRINVDVKVKIAFQKNYIYE